MIDTRGYGMTKILNSLAAVATLAAGTYNMDDLAAAIKYYGGGEDLGHDIRHAVGRGHTRFGDRCIRIRTHNQRRMVDVSVFLG